MDPKRLQDMAQEISQLLVSRLGAKGHGLRARIESRIRALPRKVRRAALALADAEAQVGAPKITHQLDARQIEHDYQTCRHYLEPLGFGARWVALALSISASVAFAILTTLVLLVVVARWRGLI
jgi:hypothetical protein